MLVRVKTQSGSVYALDTYCCMAARLQGDKETESKNAPDHVWRNYLGIEGLAVGKRLMIAWTRDKFRLTSTVTELVEIEGWFAGEISDAEILNYVSPSHE